MADKQLHLPSGRLVRSTRATVGGTIVRAVAEWSHETLCLFFLLSAASCDDPQVAQAPSQGRANTSSAAASSQPVAPSSPPTPGATAQEPKGTPLEQTSYDMAYFVLPEYANARVDRLLQLAESPKTVGPFFYVMACQGRGIEPDARRAGLYSTHRDKLDARADYLVIEYPSPPPVDFSGYEPDDLVDGKAGVLAPYFSAFVFPKDGSENLYFVLGQAPIGGGTTLRQVTRQLNANLGPGPKPTLALFLDALRARTSRK